MSVMRKTLMVVVIVILLLIVVFIILFAKKVKEISTPTTGVSIEEYEVPQKALLVIDIQEGTSGKLGEKANVLINKVNTIIDIFEKQELHIVYIKQENEDTLFNRMIFQGNLIKDSTSTQFDKRLKVVNNTIFTKTIQDSFENTQFEEYLIQNCINELYIVGVDAKTCIYSTGLGARNRNYKTCIISDAIASLTGDDLNQLISTFKEKGLGVITCNEVQTISK